MSERIGFIGLGQMGAAIARNLIESGHPLTVYNRTPGRMAPLIEAGARAAARPADAAEPGGIVLTMVSDDRALDEVVESERFLERLGRGGVHVSMSTVSPGAARENAKRHQTTGSDYVAAPVFGRPDAAAARKLWICTSGSSAARSRVRPILKAIGQETFDFGEDPGAANVVKLCGNFLIAAAMEAMGEAWTLAEKNGIAPAEMAALFGRTLFSSPVYQNYGSAIARKRFTPAGFKMALGLKDVGLVLQTAADSNVPMPAASLLRDRLLSGLAKGRQDMDWSALALGIAEDAGLAGSTASGTASP